VSTRSVVILAGGGGTRLRPLSSDENPKQFLDLFDGRSLLQLTFARLERVVAPERIFVSTNERYRAKCLEHLPRLLPANVIAEPARRNTAPAIALACRAIGEGTIGIFPADHYIADEKEFVRVIHRAFEFAAEHEFLMTIGIAPTEPASEYGYLELGEEIAPGILRVRRFTEKPATEIAQRFLRAGNYAWNGGMFVWRWDVLVRELSRAAPELIEVNLENYEQMPALSIDYALMEKSAAVATVRGAFGWSDVGSFAALRRVGGQIPEELG
jgi:mannose-1-phosphate guanylyltransferase